MPKVIEILILICLPLLWGLAVEFIFNHLLSRRKSAQAAGQGQDRDDRAE